MRPAVNNCAITCWKAKIIILSDENLLGINITVVLNKKCKKKANEWMEHMMAELAYANYQ